MTITDRLKDFAPAPLDAMASSPDTSETITNTLIRIIKGAGAADKAAEDVMMLLNIDPRGPIDRLPEFRRFVEYETAAAKPHIPDPPFGVGDIVQLKSGGRPLTVLYLHHIPKDGDWNVSVGWEHNGEIKDVILRDRALRPWKEDTGRPEPKGYALISDVRQGDCVHLITGISPRMSVYEIDHTTGMVKVEWFDDRTLKRGMFYFWQLYKSEWTPKLGKLL